MAPKPTLKLLIDRNTNKVLFGEANKDMVDFLFAILAYPVGLVTKLLTENRMAGSIGSLYKSLKDLPDEYIQPNTDKNMYLKPKLSIPATSQAALLLGLQEEPARLDFASSTSASLFRSSPAFSGSTSGSLFGCSAFPSSTSGSRFGCSAFLGSDSEFFGFPASPSLAITSIPGLVSPSMKMGHQSLCFSSSMSGPSSSSGGGGGGGLKGCVKGVVRYMVMDNLEVAPMSGISSMTLLNRFHVKDLTALEEKEVKVGMKEGLALLKASFESKTVLTDVFGGESLQVSESPSLQI
ncbi:hypothetical protein ACLOJK_028102 [Asimina triloba]